ncbi:hypothetical protein OH146_02160 [Salinibacterium sp. SYSU T00001]|uniref:hypothetical protein n=1 Tax=Homoserinimonas sedimenticola TaxID=2986805 RepID=UPI00223600A1|nr:hypothetical protein [Salinibacterium sedimenticola]MCW4384572.1 hypothetical protein [Salinibacterium sedimenticola]
MILDEDLETAVAALDWALHTGRIDSDDLDRILRSLPRRYWFIREWVDATCESLPESLSRTRLRLRGHHVITQVCLQNNRRVDLVIDGAVGLETDGEEFHWDRFLLDRLKDIEIMRADLIPLRLPAQVVFHDWELALAAVEAALKHGRSGNSGSEQAACACVPEFAGEPARRHPGRGGIS